MQKRKIAQLCISLTILTVLALLYGLSLYFHTPKYWETVALSTGVYILFTAAILKFVQAAVNYLAEGSEPHMERIGDRTFRRCGVRELCKLILLLVILRLAELPLTYILHFHLNGYDGTFFEVQRIWLDFYHVETAFPLYGYVSNLFWVFTFNFNHARFISSYVFTAIAGAALYYYVQVDFDRKTARRAVRYFFFLPISCLLMGTVPDGLFLVLSIGCLLFLRKRMYIVANVFAMLATLTHALGALLFFPILLEYTVFVVNNVRSNREMGKGYIPKQIFNALSFLLVPIGIGLVLLYAFLRFGDPLALYRASAQTYGTAPTAFSDALFDWFDRIFDATRVIGSDTVVKLIATALPQLLYLILGCLMILLGSERIRTSHVLLILLSVVAIVCSNSMDTAARYLTMTAPFTVVLSVRVKRGWVDAVLTGLFIIGWLVYFYAFVAGFTGGVL